MAYDAARGRTILFGGYAPGTPHGDTWEWDGSTWRQRTTANRPSARAGHAMTYDPVRQQIVLFGGCPGATWGTCPAMFSDETWIWDGANWSLRNPTRSPPARQHHAMSFDAARGVVVLFGGGFDDTWEWDGTTWTEVQPAVRPPSRSGHAMSYDAARQRTVMFGGSTGVIDLSNWPQGLEDTWTYDGTTWRQEAPSTKPPARALGSMVYDSNRARVVLFGGQSQAFRKQDTWEWDGARWIDRESAPIPEKRSGAAVAYFPPLRATIMFGGVFGTTGITLGDTWAWTGERWRQLHPAVSPPAADGAALAYDSIRRELVMFGSSTSTWTFDGTTWRPRTPAGSPSPRARPGMTFDRKRGVVVMYGGDSNAAFSDTWEWDGATWTQRPSPSSPSPRAAAALAYDDARGVTVMFGGNVLADTWEWDGMRWNERHPAVSPPPQLDPNLTYNPTRRRVVLVGTGTLANDLWEWDGTTWTQFSITPSPDAHVRPAIAWDGTRGHLVLFGGEPAIDVSNDTWLLGFGRDPSAVCRTGFDLDGTPIAGCTVETCADTCGTCGDGTCEVAEDCRLCPSDCGACAACGDLHCDPGEACESCPGDCGACP